MQTLNVTITYDDFDPGASDLPLFHASGWLLTRATDELVSAEASGIDPAAAFASVIEQIKSRV